MEMDKQHLYNIINEILTKWNPIGVPEEIADVEYEDYIPWLAQIVDNQEKIEDCLTSILKNIGLNSQIIHNEKVQQDIKESANAIFKECSDDTENTLKVHEELKA